MNFKKLAVTGATAALLLTSVVPAFATYDRHSRGGDNDTTVNNRVYQTNNVATVANTGANYAGGDQQNGPTLRFGGRHHSDNNNNGGDIDTGNAVAYSDVANIVSTDLGCGCVSRRGGETEVDNHVGQTNNVLTVANSGLNRTRGGGDINTGDAEAGALVTNAVNTSIGSAE